MTTFNLITGFLGSGKTSLLSNLLKELTPHKRIAVIQNEFAPTGVDGKELQQEADGFKLLEINNGSVFCVCQLSNFEQNMQKLLTEYQPEIIFLEASGLADPISISELLQVPTLQNKVRLDKVFCLVDAQNFFKGLNQLQRFKHQLMVADTLIVNKTDLYQGRISDIQETVQALNPFANVITTQYAQVDWQTLTSSICEIGKAANRFKGHDSEGRPELKTYVLRLHDKISEEGLISFIERLQDRCQRIKGFVNLTDGRSVLLQSVFNDLEIKPVNNYTGRTEIIVFGENIELGALRKQFKTIALEGQKKTSFL